MMWGWLAAWHFLPLFVAINGAIYVLGMGATAFLKRSGPCVAITHYYGEDIFYSREKHKTNSAHMALVWALQAAFNHWMGL